VKTLLLDKVYRPIAFLSFHKMVRLVMTGKADVIATWKGVPMYKDMDYPATILLKKYIRKKPLVPRFNFRGVFRRDKFTCCYSGVVLSPSQLTVDHVIPKSRKGGQSSWENCVTCSLKINAEKGDRTPEEAGLKLLIKPVAPSDSLALEYSVIINPHSDWETYFPGIRNEGARIREELEKIAS
jgi:5-methylcytosine-specific restriction endonuclease McrA